MGRHLSVWALKAAVVSTLTTVLVDANLADMVLPGLPVQLPPVEARRRVYVGDVVNDTPSPIYAPTSQLREETYILPLLVDVAKYTGNSPTGFTDTMGEMAAIVGAIENQVGADPSWGGTVHQSGVGLARESTGVLGDQGGTGYRSGAILELHVQRRGV